VATLGHKNVGGLDVAVDDAFGVGGVESFSDLRGDAKEAIEFDWLSGDEMLKGGAVKEFHGDEGAAVFFADVVDGADVGMVEGGRGFGFAAETLEGLAVGGEFFGKKFESDEAVEAGILDLIDHTHTASA
jgi:hypothetical protein